MKLQVRVPQKVAGSLKILFVTTVPRAPVEPAAETIYIQPVDH